MIWETWDHWRGSSSPECVIDTMWEIEIKHCHLSDYFKNWKNWDKIAVNILKLKWHVSKDADRMANSVSCLMTKPTKWHVRSATTQISLGITPVWSVSSLSAWRKLGSLATHWAHNEDLDQTGRMPRLIWVFAGCTVILLVSSGGSLCRPWWDCFFRRHRMPGYTVCSDLSVKYSEPVRYVVTFLVWF